MINPELIQDWIGKAEHKKISGGSHDSPNEGVYLKQKYGKGRTIYQTTVYLFNVQKICEWKELPGGKVGVKKYKFIGSEMLTQKGQRKY